MTLPTIIPASAAVESDELVLLLVVGAVVGDVVVPVIPDEVLPVTPDSA